MTQPISDGINTMALDRQLRSLDPGECVEIAASPTLSQLAVVRDLADPLQAGLWATPEAGQEPFPLATSQALARLIGSPVEAIITRPRWSTDGQWLAFASYEGLPPGQAHTLWIVEAQAGSSPKPLYQGAGLIAGHLWSPAGDCLAVADSDAGLVIVHLNGTSQVADADGMQYPLGENAMAWLEDGRRLLYMNLATGKTGLWRLEMPDAQKQQVVALSPDEIMIPATVSAGPQVAWGALRGNMLHPGQGVMLHLWPDDESEPETIPWPGVEFDPASSLLPNDDGSLWACIVWVKGQRAPLVMDPLAHRGRVLAVPGDVIQLLGWSTSPPRLWVLLHPIQLAGLGLDGPSEPASASDGVFSLDLTPDELVCLLEALGATRMVGLTSLFADVPPGEAAKRKTAAKAAMASKGYLTVSLEGRVQLDLTIAALVQCCATPQQTWTMTFQDTTGARDVRHIHRVQDLIVEDAILASGTHRLTSLRDEAAVFLRIQQQLRLNVQPAAAGQSFVLPEEILFRIKEIAAAGGEEAAARYLAAMGVTEATAACFVQALVRPVSNSSISRWAAAGEEAAASTEEGLGVLEGASGLWLLQPLLADGTAWVRVSPADATTAMRQIEGLFAQKTVPSSTG